MKEKEPSIIEEQKDAKPSSKKAKKILIITVFFIGLMTLLGLSYAYYQRTVFGNKKQIITASTLNLIFEEGNSIEIKNAYPSADEVGLLQEAFLFNLKNNGDDSLKYEIKIIDTTEKNKMEESIIKYSLTKNSETKIGHIVSLEDNTIDTGIIRTDEEYYYQLRLWIDESAEDESTYANLSRSYRIDITAGELQTTTANYVVDTNTQYQEDVEIGQTVLSPTTFIPEKEGWTFIGWKEDTLASSDVLTNKDMSNEEMTLYAVYEQDVTATFTSYNSNETASGTRYYNAAGSTTNPSVTIPTGGSYSGWSWLGWSAADETTGNASVTYANGETINVTGNQTYYGLYSSTITLSYNGNGNTSGSTEGDSGTVYYNASGSTTGATFTLKTSGYSKTNYNFLNWRLNSASGTAYSAGATVTLTASATMYAYWRFTSQTFAYSTSTQSFQSPESATYKIELYGAGSASGQAGAKLIGNIYLAQNTTVYFLTGGKASGGTGGSNGGGSGANGGGGATQLTTTNRGTLTNYQSYTSEVLAVAAGAGGDGAWETYHSTAWGTYIDFLTPDSGHQTTVGKGGNSGTNGSGGTNFRLFDNNGYRIERGSGGGYATGAGGTAVNAGSQNLVTGYGSTVTSGQGGGGGAGWPGGGGGSSGSNFGYRNSTGQAFNTTGKSGGAGGNGYGGAGGAGVYTAGSGSSKNGPVNGTSGGGGAGGTSYYGGLSSVTLTNGANTSNGYVVITFVG